MTSIEFLEIVKTTDGWALRKGPQSPHLLASSDKDFLIAAGRRVAIVFGLRLMVDGQPILRDEEVEDR